MTPEIKVKIPTVTEGMKIKNKLNERQVGSQEDWEGGASRPTDDVVPDAVLPNNSPAKNLQAQADSVPKAVVGDNGPPKNLQSLPTQDTHEVHAEEKGQVAAPGIPTNYKCPICSKEIPIDLTLFLDQSKQQHVIQSIQKAHPEWSSEKGVCVKCVDYYENTMEAAIAPEATKANPSGKI